MGVKVGTGLLKHLKIDFELDTNKANALKEEVENKEIKNDGKNKKEKKKEVKMQKNLFDF